MPHLSGLSNVRQLLDLRSVAQLRLGENDRAFEGFLTVNRLGVLLKDDPSEMNLYSSAHFHAQALATLWEGLRVAAWDDEKLTEAESVLSNIDLRAAGLRTTRFNRAVGCASWIEVASTKELNREAWVIFTKCIPDGWFYQNSVSFGQSIHDGLLYRNGTRIHRIEWSDVEAFATNANVIAKSRTPYEWISGIALPLRTETFKMVFHRQADINNARVAIALERYRLQFGYYPDELDTLQPDLIAEVPADIITGAPLKYYLRADGSPCIYSVGIDRIDEKGLPSADFARGDWVWHYSMSEGFKIKDYYYRD